MIKARIRRLNLDHFRTYRAASLAVSGEGPIVLFGPNGAGKTNVLEAISFLTTGRGLRRATLDEVAYNEGDRSWAVAAELEGALGLATLGTGILAPLADETARTRLFRIDREPVSSAQAFAEHVAILWLTPSMDGLFSGAASERRRFFDRLVLATDGSHQARVNALERGLRSRNRLLEAHHPDPLWLDAIERELAEIGVAVAAARAETALRIKPLLAARKATSSAFPWARMTLDGELENAIGSMPSIAIEDAFRARLKQNRARDAAAGRTLIGPHLTDLIVHHGPTGMNAASASTGEQKALLIGFVLAQAELIAGMTGCTPILLLDEIGAHLDTQRRLALFAELDALGAQSWMTGADPDLFKGIGPAAQTFEVQLGTANRVTGRF